MKENGFLILTIIFVLVAIIIIIYTNGNIFGLLGSLPSVIIGLISFIEMKNKNNDEKFRNLVNDIKFAIKNFKENNQWLVEKSGDNWICKPKFKDISDLIFKALKMLDKKEQTSEFKNILKSSLDNVVLNLLILDLKDRENSEFIKLLEKYQILYGVENPYNTLYADKMNQNNSTGVMKFIIECKKYIDDCIVAFNKKYPQLFGLEFERIAKSYGIKNRL
ncbi:hypothetical protein OFO10_02150 [Campylobacter sp. VBCF_06 NA8]|uniref:hypothetical protein n=1 Tax=Campylobacter sp. VBCF_06 NA8 TaxID=2983822 RepID=UPI0022EA045C|nr:hypothetical protein [Campylobacter sp. VBCF_06 NA8]MDA3045957.1 hypothetical protein [Campylobacter sp. VBCF_06 NA8]